VSFKYPQGKNRYALENLSFDAMPGEIVGIVGPSGAGKSTLFLLLMGFYDIDSGSIAIDDRNLNTVEAPHLRQNIAIVPQDIFLFSGTVEENIRYGRLDASPEEIRTVAKQAGAHDFIEQFPNGYRETVGNKGFKLSAGQRQRLAIARALLANPSILLLDEATSSLDADSEELVGKALITLFRNRTTLVIAHRLITARRADRILVVEKGKIITSGTHDFLYSNDSLYRRYWDLQSQTKSFELRPEGSFQGSPLSGAPIT
jgi:ABC-type multidrug transport system fused ATPase/permease subunit